MPANSRWDLIRRLRVNICLSKMRILFPSAAVIVPVSDVYVTTRLIIKQDRMEIYILWFCAHDVSVLRCWKGAKMVQRNRTVLHLAKNSLECTEQYIVEFHVRPNTNQSCILYVFD